MKALLIMLMLLNFFLIHGCALFLEPKDDRNNLNNNLNAKINSWLKQQEYSKALDAISYMQKKHPQYTLLQKRKIRIQKSASKFEKIKLREINAHITAKDWHTAEKSLNDSLKKLPDSVALQKSHRDFIRKRASHLKSLYYKLSINKAVWLVKNKDIQEELSQTIPDQKAAQTTLAQHKKETDQVYQQLVVCGIEGMNIGDLELAEQCFLLAHELKPSKALRSSITDIQRELSIIQKRETLILSKKARKLLNQSRTSMQAGKLKQALSLYNKISRKDKKHALTRAFNQELKSRIKDNVTTRIETGRKFYSQGDIKLALATWNKVLELDAGNEYLLSHIERAQKVMDKLVELRNQKYTVAPPTQNKNLKN